MRKNELRIFYRPEQVCEQDIQSSSFSKSPLKPKLLLEHIMMNKDFREVMVVDESFAPFNRKDFRLAHHKSYVKNFFNGKGNCRSNSLPWSEELVESVRYTNASLYNAIEYSIDNPDTFTLSPTSGFHHAQPSGGGGFCTFSGQVIASTKLWNDRGLRGAYFDLDGHFGNSIEDSRSFVKSLNDSIPFNVNPKGSGESYMKDFKKELGRVIEAIENDEVDYVVWCHGADSHEWDSLGNQVSTEQWVECSRIFYSSIANAEARLGRCIPVTAALFGGYRDDDYNSVISLHASDLRDGCEILNGSLIDYTTRVKPREPRKFWDGFEHTQETHSSSDTLVFSEELEKARRTVVEDYGYTEKELLLDEVELHVNAEATAKLEALGIHQFKPESPVYSRLRGLGIWEFELEQDEYRAVGYELSFDADADVYLCVDK